MLTGSVGRQLRTRGAISYQVDGCGRGGGVELHFVALAACRAAGRNLLAGVQVAPPLGSGRHINVSVGGECLSVWLA
jgi:hypothetical protein